MEFVETPTFWCPHVDPAACTNFSPRTFERRPPETQEIFLFPFLLSPFPPFSLYGFFPFFSFLPFLPFFSFFSFLISFPFHFSSFSLLLFVIFSPFLEKALIRSNEAISSSFPLPICVANTFPFFFFLYLYDIITHMASCEPWNFFSHTWLIVSHGIHALHVAQCEPSLFNAKCHSLEVPCGISIPCHVSSDTPRLEKREIPTTSEFNEIRRGG